MILYCNARERTITVEDSKQELSIEVAKGFWLAGKVDDCNLALQRLVSMDWDFDRLNKYYDDCDTEGCSY